MAKLVIFTDFTPGTRSQFTSTGNGHYPSRCCYGNGGGYASKKDMVRAIKSRFPHRNPVDITDGVELRGDYGTFQRITFED